MATAADFALAPAAGAAWLAEVPEGLAWTPTPGPVLAGGRDPARGPGRPLMATDGAPSGAVLIVVRRNATARFQQLQTAFGPAAAQVIWDRRVAERRRGGRRGTTDRRGSTEGSSGPTTERRAAERRWEPERRVAVRRRKPPETWTALDFVVVRVTEPGPVAGAGDEAKTTGVTHGPKGDRG